MAGPSFTPEVFVNKQTSRTTPADATALNKLGSQYDAMASDIVDPTTPVGAALSATIGTQVAAGAGKVAATVTTSITAVVSKHNPVDATAAAVAVALPTGQPEGTFLSVEKTDTTKNTVTVSGSLRGATATIVQTLPHETVEFRADSTGSWWPISGHKTLSSLKTALGSSIDPGTILPAKFDMGDSPINFGLAGDSTGDDLHSSGNHFEWFYRGVQSIVDRYPAYECSYWTSWYTFLTGTSTPRASYDKYRIVPIGPMYDEFTGSGELNGKAGTTGQTWVCAGGTGKWTVSGGFAVPLASSQKANLTYAVAQAGNGRRVSGMVQMDTTAPASAERSFTVEIGADANNLISLKIAVSTGGIAFYAISKTIAGVTTANIAVKNPSTTILTPLSPTGLTNTLIPFSLEIKPTQISAFVNAESTGVTLTGADFTALGGLQFAQMSSSLQGTSTIQVDRIGLGELQATPKLVQVWNGSRAGSTLDAQTTDQALLWTTQLDALFISSSHNYLADDGPTYTTKVQTFVDTFLSFMPNVGITFCSQNPEFTPATFIYRQAHNKRLPQIRAYANARGWGYLPLGEAFFAQSDGGAALVGSDGVHPLAPAGMIREGKAFSDNFASKSLLPAP